MPRNIHRLTPLKVKNAKGPVKLCDGGGLWLFINSNQSKSWVFRYNLNGREREMGLGAIHTIPLKDAREDAAKYRALKLKGVDPIEHRKGERSQKVTFKECAEAYIESHRPGWKSKKHAEQWQATIEEYAYPVLEKMLIGNIDTSAVIQVLKPIWQTKTETATRVRQRMEVILDSASASGQRTGENPARWKGHLDKLFPKRSKVQKVRHHPALPYTEIPVFIKKLNEHTGIGANALKFTVLNAARTGEVINATWDEIDLEAGIWTIPGDRMKSGREHRVPLSSAALELLSGLARVNTYVFPGWVKDKPISNMTMLKLLKKDLGYSDKTVHGFRSSFRDWAAETTNFPSEVVEMALAHVIENQTEAAYRRGDLFTKRQKLMESWACFTLSSTLSAVVSINGTKSRAS